MNSFTIAAALATAALPAVALALGSLRRHHRVDPLKRIAVELHALANPMPAKARRKLLDACHLIDLAHRESHPPVHASWGCNSFLRKVGSFCPKTPPAGAQTGTICVHDVVRKQGPSIQR